MNMVVISLKREIWEHHGSIIKLPIILLALFTAAIVASAFMIGKIAPQKIDMHFDLKSFQQQNEYGSRQFDFEERIIGDIDPGEMTSNTNDPELGEVIAYSLSSPYIIIHRIMLIVIISYLLTCLSTDRRDYSILFWKSMPVSEAQSIGFKLLTGLVVIPAIAWCVSLILSIFILTAELTLAAASPIEGLAGQIWEYSSVTGTAWRFIGAYLSLSLWFLPIAAWAMFASAISKKNVFLSAALPPFVLVVAEGMFFKTHRTIDYVIQHASGLIPESDIFMFLDPGWLQIQTVVTHTHFLLSLPAVALLLYATMWLRENRFED